MRARLMCLVAAATITSSFGLQAPALSAPTAPLVLSARGLSVVPLGTRESVAERSLKEILGSPTSPLTSTPGLSNCGLDASSSWHGLSVFFDHGRLVGLALGPRVVPFARTSKGLELGDTLGHARVLYGSTLRTSTDQGGVWFVITREGRIDGFLNPSTGRTPTPSARILTIDVGVVGCPAMSP